MWLFPLLMLLTAQEWQFRIEAQALSAAAGQSEYFVVFTAEWCGPCRQLKDQQVPKLKQAGYQVTVVDIEKDTQWKSSVASLPTIWLVDRESRWPIEKWVGYTQAAELMSPQSIDGVCRLSANNKKWTGVAIGPDLVLTCAHHDEADNLRVEFPIPGAVGQYVSVRGRVRKFDRKSDLSIVEFRLPAKYRLKAYPVRAGKPVRVKGYREGTKPETIDIIIEGVSGTVEGVEVKSVKVAGQAHSGMSGSPVFAMDGSELVITGIQFGGKGDLIDFATVDSINKILQEASRESGQ